MVYLQILCHLIIIFAVFETSPTIAALAKALSAAQGEVEGAVKGKANPAFRDESPYFLETWWPQPPISRRERYDLVRGMIVIFLCLWMVCTRVTLIWSVLRGGKGSIRPKVRFENSAYGQGLRGR